jgi:multimeric flavodoxin WrbA/putative sterol carrier protein
MKRMANALPHIVIAIYTVLVSAVHLQLSSLRFISVGALVIMGIIALRERPASPIVKGYALYFILNAVGFWLMPDRSFHPLTIVPASFLYACFLMVALIPPLFGGTLFTEYFARKTTPEPVWETDVFKAIMHHMSLMWCGLFTVSLIVGTIPVATGMPRGALVSVVFQILLPGLIQLGLGVRLNDWYPGYYQRKHGIDPDALSKSLSENTPNAAENAIAQKEENMSDRRVKVVVVNGSPKAAGGNTGIMTQMVSSALEAEGIMVEEIFLAEHQLEFCIGCGVCTEKGRCWRSDDHASIIEKVLSADGLILASPVYFGLVTAQMKVFLDRSLAYGHKPRTSWKPGLAISVSAGKGETATADYLAGELRVYGFFSVGTLTAIAVQPGAFLGMDLVEARAADLAKDLARAIKEKRRFPATDRELSFYLFMGDLIRKQKDFMRDDYRHWQESGFYDGFESYVGQTFTHPPYNKEMRKEWIKGIISEEAAKAKGKASQKRESRQDATSPGLTCLELIRRMPMGFRKDKAADMNAVYQFEINGPESFTGHLVISKGTCSYVDGPASKPDVTIKSPADVWLAVSNGSLNGQSAFMAGKYKVEGNMGLLMNLSKLFTS